MLLFSVGLYRYEILELLQYKSDDSMLYCELCDILRAAHSVQFLQYSSVSIHFTIFIRNIYCDTYIFPNHTISLEIYDAQALVH